MLTSLLDLVNNKATAAAGFQNAPSGDLVNNKATAAAGFQNAPLATPKHHGPEGRNDLQINRKNKFPGGRNVPSESVLEIFSSLILLSC